MSMTQNRGIPVGRRRDPESQTSLALCQLWVVTCCIGTQPGIEPDIPAGIGLIPGSLDVAMIRREVCARQQAVAGRRLFGGLPS